MIEKEIDLDTKMYRFANQVVCRAPELERYEGKLAVDKLWNLIFKTAIDARATDIHIEPQKNDIRIRYRVDGMLCEFHRPIDIRAFPVLDNRLKIISDIDSLKRFLPLDGHLNYEYEGKTIDMRISTMPTKYEETIVIRLMDVTDELKTIDELGMSDSIEKVFRNLVHSQNGLFIVTGPMNSGKSTSLYAALRELNDCAQSIMTIEDPIEQLIPGIVQMETNERVGLDFAKSLRSLLRMDCNTIMLGEIRDVETAQIAVRAALTGHLILTTVHAKDSCGTIFRLLDMNVEPYLLAITLTGVLSQRLVRKLCPNCKQAYEVTPESFEAGILGKYFHQGMTLYRPVGCETCRNTGFKGRLAIHEILQIDEDFRKLILHFKDVDDLRHLAMSKNFINMFEDGIQKVVAGLTTINEVSKVL